MDIRNALRQLSDKLDEDETRRANMTPSQKWIKRALSPIGYISTVVIVCVIWFVLGGLATRASQATGFFPSGGSESLAVFAAGVPALALITVIIRAIVCLSISGIFKLIEHGIRFVKRL